MFLFRITRLSYDVGYNAIFCKQRRHIVLLKRENQVGVVIRQTLCATLKRIASVVIMCGISGFDRGNV